PAPISVPPVLGSPRAYPPNSAGTKLDGNATPVGPRSEPGGMTIAGTPPLSTPGLPPLLPASPGGAIARSDPDGAELHESSARTVARSGARRMEREHTTQRERTSARAKASGLARASSG